MEHKSQTFGFEKFSLQIDKIDYTDSGDECTNKCQWYHDTKHTSEFIMRCLDYNGTWAQCTPFDCKISFSYIESTYQTYFSKVNKKITTVYHCTISPLFRCGFC